MRFLRRRCAPPLNRAFAALPTRARAVRRPMGLCTNHSNATGIHRRLLMLDWHRRIHMRAYVSLVIGALLFAGCATSSVSSRVAPQGLVDEPSASTLTRCSAADPNRWAWFCVIGQSLYGIGANLQPDAQYRFK